MISPEPASLGLIKVTYGRDQTLPRSRHALQHAAAPCQDAGGRSHASRQASITPCFHARCKRGWAAECPREGRVTEGWLLNAVPLARRKLPVVDPLAHCSACLRPTCFRLGHEDAPCLRIGLKRGCE